MTLAIRKAIFDRWNNAGLDAAIAPLFAGERDASPEGTPLPRAQYSLPSESERTRSRTTGERIQEVRIQIWGRDDATVQQYVDLAEEAFVNSESAANNPFAIAGDEGQILSVEFAGQSVVQEATALFQGILQLRIQWCRPITA